MGNFFWNGTVSFDTFVETEISCYVTRFPLILTARFHSLYVNGNWSRKFWKLGVGNFGKSESDILPPTPQPWYQACGLSSLVLGVDVWMQENCSRGICCHWFATSAAFTANTAAWPIVQANGDWRPQTSRDKRVETVIDGNVVCSFCCNCISRRPRKDKFGMFSEIRNRQQNAKLIGFISLRLHRINSSRKTSFWCKF